MRKRNSLLLTFAVLAVTSLAAQPTQAQSAADFYKGKTVNMIVGGSPGGGYDTVARAIARFIGKHIPGAPNVVVRNMPGAGGMQAMDYLYNTAEKDGSVIGLVENTTPLAPLFGGKEVRYDATKFNWLGTPSIEVGLVIVWHAVPVNSIDDLKTHPTTMGASGAQSTQAFYTRLLNATLGTKMKTVSGYRGQNDIFLAMERGEIDGYPSVYYSSLTSTRPTWLPEKLAKVLLQYGPEPLKEMPNVPYAFDLLSNPDDKLLLRAAAAPQALGRPLVMPPGVPADRLAVMRNALTETFADAEFKADADKLGLIVNAPQTGQRLQSVIEQAYASPPRVVERLRQLENATEQ